MGDSDIDTRTVCSDCRQPVTRAWIRRGNNSSYLRLDPQPTPNGTWIPQHIGWRHRHDAHMTVGPGHNEHECVPTSDPYQGDVLPQRGWYPKDTR